MARRLKAFTTTAGFFDLAVAAPSMKAALAAWGAKSNLFHQGFAQESHAVDIITSTMAHPGVVLRRPVGTKQAFAEEAEVSDDFVYRTRRPEPKAKARARAEPEAKTKTAPTKSSGQTADRRAALAYEREAAKKEKERRTEEAARKKERERREKAIAGAEAALREAEQDHIRTLKEIDKAQAALERRSDDEKTRWKVEQGKLQEAVREARSPRHLRIVR